MAQTTMCVFKYGDQDPIRIIAPRDLKAGEVYLLGTRALIVVAAVKSGDVVALATSGAWAVPKDNTTPAAGVAIGWNAAGNPLGGTAGSGAGVPSATGLPILGFATYAATATDTYVETWLSVAAATITGAAP